MGIKRIIGNDGLLYQIRTLRMDSRVQSTKDRQYWKACRGSRGSTWIILTPFQSSVPADVQAPVNRRHPGKGPLMIATRHPLACGTIASSGQSSLQNGSYAAGSTVFGEGRIYRISSGLFVRSRLRIYRCTSPKWPAPGSADTELGVLMEPEVCHGETEVYTGVQA